MSKKFLIIFLIVALAVLTVPRSSNAFSIGGVLSAIRTAVGFLQAIKQAGNNPGMFKFGGHITHSEGGCHIKYMVFIYVCAFGFPCVFPGVPISIGGNTIEVGPPLPGPTGQMFTFPGISDIYNNHHEDQEGVWALGLGYSPFPIDRINDALGNIPNIPIPDGFLFNFSLDCSENNKNVILKLGTS